MNLERWARELAELQSKTKRIEQTGQRMKWIASTFVNRPYLENPLIGGPKTKERLSINLAGFDCVTFVESVLAISRSRSKSGFLNEIKNIRYRDGKISWEKRLHYFSEWMNSNSKKGILKLKSLKPAAKKIRFKLAIIKDLPVKKLSMNVVPKNRLYSVSTYIEDGTIIAFATTRANLDYFHTGLLFWKDEPKSELFLYHASKTKGCVIKEPLKSFLKRNRMRGFSLAVPT